MADDYGMVIVDAERDRVSLARPKSWDDVVREHAVSRGLSAEDTLSAEEKMAIAVVTAEMAIIPAQREIYSSLRRGALVAWARPNGSGDIVQISLIQWAALRFRSHDGRDIAIPVDSEHRSLLRRALPDYLDGSVPATSSPTAWPDPLFSADQAMRLWPPSEPNATVLPDQPTGENATDRPEHGEWVRLQEGEGFIEKIWPESDARQRREAVIAILFAGEVSKWVRLEGASPPEREIADLLAGVDRRNVTIDLPNSRIVVRGFRIKTDLPALPLWPGGPPKMLQGEDARWDLREVRFAREPAQAYGIKKLVPQNPTSLMPTGAPGRPSKGMHVIRIEFDRRRIANECKPSLREEAEELESWFRNGYPTAQPVTRKTIENNIRSDYRDWAVDLRSAEP